MRAALLTAAAAALLAVAPAEAQEAREGRVWTPDWAPSWVAKLLRQGPIERDAGWDAARRRVVGGDPARGAALLPFYGCGACHSAPGGGEMRGSVGPDLAGFARRSYIAGVLPNRPGDLVSWLMDPPAHAPQTAMPDMGVTRADARDIAAWLYTLEDG